MNPIKSTIYLLITGVALSIFGWYYSNQHTTSLLDHHSLSSTVDTTITSLIVKQFNKEGLLANVMTTPLLEHLPQKKVHLIKSPYILINQKDQPAWEISSQRAKSFKGGQKIVFIRHVVVHQKTGYNTPESTLKTEEITYFPKEKKAVTDLFVTFEQPGNTMQSTGMNAYLDTKRVELLHGARGRYDPHQQHS